MDNNNTPLIYSQYSGESRMFFGEGRGLQEFITPAYPEFLKLSDQLKEQDWAHDEFALTLDAAQLNNANQSIRHIFTSNLQGQIFADTVQGRGPAWLIPYSSDPAIEALFARWAANEAVHSRSYTQMLTAMYPNPSLIIQMIERKPEIFKRFSQCLNAYDTFFANPNEENLILLIGAINILEGLAFYASFACNFGFANMGLFESVSKYLILIAKDEHLHLAITQRIIKNWRTGKDGKLWKEAWNDNKLKIRDMYISGLEEEEAWNKYLFKFGTPIVGLNDKLLSDYNEFRANGRMKGLGLKPATDRTKDPLPWIQLKYLTQKGYQAAPQEVSVASYRKSPINKMEDLSQLKRLF